MQNEIKLVKVTLYCTIESYFKRVIVKISILIVAISAVVLAKPICNFSTENKIIECLKRNYSRTNELGYRQARSIMFTSLDNEGGKVQLVYSGFWYKTDRIPNHTIVNTEHIWPQSRFGRNHIKTDLHHMYPTYNRINGQRANYPFAEIPDNLTELWLIKNNKGYKKKPNKTKIDNYSEYYRNSFEPREAHKGAVARSMFYIHALYDHSSSNSKWFYNQLETLKKWNKRYPITEKEIQRNKRIKRVQGNYNPFIIDQSLVYRLYK